MLVEFSSLPERLQIRRNEISKLGFPRAEYFSNKARMNDQALIQEVMAGMVDMDDPAVPGHVKDDIEFTIDLSDDDFHRLQYQVKRNNTRVDELKQIRKQVLDHDRLTGNTKRIDQDVLIFYIDNISRAHFHRKLKQTAAWLGQFVDNDDAELEAVEFFRYHSVSGVT